MFRKRTFLNERQTTQPISTPYRNAKTVWTNSFSSLITCTVWFRCFGTSLASKLYKAHLIVCRLEMMPYITPGGMNRVWFVRVSLRWFSEWRFHTYVIRPPHSFQNAEEAVARGFRYAELWVDEKISKPRKAPLARSRKAWRGFLRGKPGRACLAAATSQVREKFSCVLP